MFKFFKSLFFDQRSPKWSDIRKDHIKHQSSCQACGRIDNLEVHHIEPFHISPDRELDPDNLITLCSKGCHLMFGHLMDYKSWNPEVVKDCQYYLSKIKKRPYHDKLN